MIKFRDSLLFSLILLISAVGESSAAADDYGSLWWAMGNPYYQVVRPCDAIPPDYPGRKQVLCFHTGRYGMSIDTINLNKISLGNFENHLPYEAEIAEITEAFAGLAESKLSIEVHAGGKIYRCVGRETPKSSFLFPVRFIEYGRYFQHVQITNLIMEDDSGERLKADCWLEISSWPDSLNISCHVDSKKVKPEKIILSTGAKQAGGILHKGGEALVVLPLVKAADRADLKDVNIHAFWKAKVAVACPESNGGHVITIRGRGMKKDTMPKYSRKGYLDRFDKWPFTLRNDSTKPKTFRLLFDTSPFSITGYTPMILDEEGNPTGIRVQTSKNWHRGKQRVMYEGAWTHGSTVITLPPKTTRKYQFAETYARWGGVPAASHAQLCLIGWGHNMMWEECALGSFGESICYEPGRTQRRCFITDVRPFLVTKEGGRRWSWTGNAGGGDFLVYFDTEGKYVPMVRTRGRYYGYGPNLTKVSYDEVSQDEAIKASYTVRIARSDDYLRIFHNIRYDVLKPVDFSRLAFCQMPSDYYNDMKYKQIAIGNVDGMTAQWPLSTNSWQYDKRSVPLPGRHPWVSLHDVVPAKRVTQAARGFIVRKWDAVLGSKKCAQPHLSTYTTTVSGPNSLAATELSPPPGLTQLQPGDYVDVDMELVVLPSKEGIYYGPNTDFIAALASDVNTWKMVHREAVGNDLKIAMKDGNLLNSYPMEIAVSAGQAAQFTVSGGVGYVPITFTGLNDYKGYKIYRRVAGKDVAVDQSVHGKDFWQTDYDAAGKTWSITYNINLDSSDLADFIFKK